MKGTWLVVGCAECVARDIEETPGWERAIVVNRMIRDWRLPADFGATVHPEMAAGWSQPGRPIASNKAAPGVSRIWEDPEFQHGTSGLYAVGLALALGAERIHLAGVPLDATPHYYAGTSLAPYLDHYRAAWLRVADRLRGRVFSPSGWTKDLLR